MLNEIDWVFWGSECECLIQKRSIGKEKRSGCEAAAPQRVLAGFGRILEPNAWVDLLGFR